MMSPEGSQGAMPAAPPPSNAPRPHTFSPLLSHDFVVVMIGVLMAVGVSLELAVM
jgi:hypothetical protein